MQNSLFRSGLVAIALLAAVMIFAPQKVMSLVTAPEPKPFDDVLAELAKQPSFSIVQVGAYIGDTENDPLFDFLRKHLDSSNQPKEATVILVEPIREYFDQLVENYEGTSNVACENVAIANQEGEMEMYRLDANPVDYGFPEWLAQLSSLKKERMEELWNGYENCEAAQKWYLEHRVVETVKCVTIHQLLDKHNLEQLDLLQLDVEGYDYEILKTLDFARLKPRFINYERVLLQDQEPACRALLESHGYELIDWGQDTFCILRDNR